MLQYIIDDQTRQLDWLHSGPGLKEKGKKTPQLSNHQTNRCLQSPVFQEVESEEQAEFNRMEDAREAADLKRQQAEVCPFLTLIIPFLVARVMFRMDCCNAQQMSNRNKK